MIKIDTEFKSLIPPLSDDEFQQLEENCLAEGIRDALVVWKQFDGNQILIDGHNRFNIANKHGLEYKTEEKSFDSRSDALMWVIRNQLGRRNLSAYDRSVLALKLKPLIAEKAKAKQAETLKQNVTVNQKSDEREELNTAKQLADIAQVSHDTIHKVETIEKKATPEVKQQVRSGEKSINKAYSEIKKVEAIENSGNEYLKENVRAGKTTIDDAYRVVTGTQNRSPAQSKKEFINNVKQERKEFQEKKTDSIVTIGEIRKDEKNRKILASDIFMRLLRMGDGIDKVAFDIKNDDIDLKELSSEWSDEQIKTLDITITSLIRKLTAMKGIFNT